MRISSLIMIAGLLLIPCCVSKPSKEDPPKKPENNPLIIPFNNNFDFKNIKPGHIAEGTDYVISKADFIKNEIVQIANTERTYENTLVRIDDIYSVIESVWSPGYLMGSVHTSEEIRNEGLEASKNIENYITELSLNEDLYNAVVAYVTTAEAKRLKGFRKKYLDDLLLDYKRIGFTLSKDEREKVKTVLDVLTDLGLEFDKNIRAAQDTLFLDQIDLAGLPDNYKKERLQKNGKYAIDMTYPSYVPFMDQAESDEAREALRFKFNNRARAENIGVLNDILRNRMKMVKLLGYNSYAEYRTEDRMARNPKNVWDFENNLKQQLREKAENDVAEMLTIKSVRLGKNTKTIHPWEAGFYENQVKLKITIWIEMKFGNILSSTM